MCAESKDVGLKTMSALENQEENIQISFPFFFIIFLCIFIKSKYLYILFYNMKLFLLKELKLILEGRILI